MEEYRRRKAELKAQLRIPNERGGVERVTDRPALLYEVYLVRSVQQSQLISDHYSAVKSLQEKTLLTQDRIRRLQQSRHRVADRGVQVPSSRERTGGGGTIRIRRHASTRLRLPPRPVRHLRPLRIEWGAGKRPSPPSGVPQVVGGGQIEAHSAKSGPTRMGKGKKDG